MEGLFIPKTTLESIKKRKLKERQSICIFASCYFDKAVSMINCMN